MMLSRKQKVFIWSSVILVVLFLGFGRKPKAKVVFKEIITSYKTRQVETWSAITFYGIETVNEGEKGYGLLSGIEAQKYLLSFVSLLIGSTLTITTRKR